MQDKSIYNTLLTYLKTLFIASPSKFLTSLVLLISISFTESLSLITIFPLLQVLGLKSEETATSKLTEITQLFFNTINLKPTLTYILILYALLAITQAFIYRLQTISNQTLISNFAQYLKTNLYNTISNTSWLFFLRNKSSYFAQALTTEIDRIYSGTYFLLQLISNSIIILIYSILAFTVSFKMTMIVLTIGLFISFLLKNEIKKSHDLGRDFTTQYGKAYSSTLEHLGALKTIKCYNKEQDSKLLFNKLIRNIETLNLKTTSVSANVKFLFDLTSALVITMTLYISFEILKIQAANLFFLFFLFARIMPRISTLQQNQIQVASVLPAFENIITIQESCKSNSDTLNKGTNKIPIIFNKNIELSNISFGYEKGQETISNISLLIERGKTTAIVGPSGSGKSTIIDLIIGLLIPNKGTILIDGIPLTAETTTSWREQISHVSQDTFLFNDSIRANLLWACPHASEKEILEAVKISSLKGFISSLPNGLETIIGDRGVLLSHGERQRLALARAILRKPSLLILDEATSSLDSENEKYIQETIEQFHGNITVLIISHRLSTICNSDKIYVLDSGNIIESGNWNNLIANKTSKFYKLFLAQQAVLTS